MNKAKILVIDDEKNILKVIELTLSSQNYLPEVFLNPLDALKRAQEVYFDIAFVDLKMEQMDGLEVLSRLKKISPDTTIVLMTAFASVETAVEAIKGGAYDYITKPFTHKEFILLTDRVFEYHKIKKELQGLKSQFDDDLFSGDFITQNFQVREILKTAKEIAQSDIPVLIEGESGTGKEILARYIHNNSKRKDYPFTPINCAAIPENLFESEVFGHVKGSFTGALKDRIGRFETGNLGTVFLDEVAEISKPMQVKLLRFLQNMEFERIGESITRKIDVRIISATNRNIKQSIQNGDLRDDFYYRLNGISFLLPPLKERKDDIPYLIDFFLKKYSPGNEINITPETIQILNKYDWPGNIRELENVTKRLIIFAKDQLIQPDILPPEISNDGSKSFSSLMPTLEEVEKDYIKSVLRSHPLPKDAAGILGISLTTLWRKRKELKI
jgi:DNA-binding NtrC family response regulator